jgi:hypothetical protein
MTEAAEFLLEEAKRDFERVSGSSASHEDKARAVLGIVAGATGALGVFGVSKDGQTTSRRPSLSTPSFSFSPPLFVFCTFSE